ncbi:T9SS type A sorting domain-containing protein [bacterium]|nr:T9SS type A sorting domain-containing protein [bacterium]
MIGTNNGMRRTVLLFLLLAACVDAQVRGLKGWNIVLDPGHSQKENMGIYNYSEAEKNVRVALALRDILLQTTDIDTVYLTRTDDRQIVGLTQRSDYANSLGAAWFHSIHSNAPGANGSAETNNTLLLWGQYRSGQEKVPNGGKKMSSHMVDLLTRGMRIPTAGSFGDCSFYGCTSSGPYLSVNRNTAMPSELSEAGYHTNHVQNTRNMNAEWKRMEAMTFYWSILDFHKITRPPVQILAGFVTDQENGDLVNGARITVAGRTYVTDSYGSLFHHYSSAPELLRNGFYYFENLPSSPLTVQIEAEDFYGDTLEVALIDTFITFKDITLISKRPPFVQASTPAAGEDRFPAWEAITLLFSRPMDPACVEKAFSLSPAAHGTFTWFNDHRSLAFKPDTLQFETEYTLTISPEALDRYGHQLDGDQNRTAGDAFVMQFTTGPADLTPPRIVGATPKPNTQNVAPDAVLNFHYNEAIDSASVHANRILLTASGQPTPVSGKVRNYIVDNRSVLSFFPVENLLQNTTYKVQLLPGFSDLLGNTSTQQTTFYFKTSSTLFTPMTLDDYEQGAGGWWAPQGSGHTTGIVSEKTSLQVDSLHVNLKSGSSRSLRLNYAWDTNRSAWFIREYLEGGPAKELLFDSSFVLQMWVFGDGSKTQIRFCVDDRVPEAAAANHEVSPWFVIDWLGWKLVQWDIANTPAGQWLGDGRLDGELAFDSIQLTYTPGGKASGTLYFDDLQIGKKITAGANRPVAAQLPEHFSLQQNYPNPFNAETVIHYHAQGSNRPMVLKIYDLNGRTVRTFTDLLPGAQSISWDGRDESGRPVATGVYLYQLRTAKTQQTRKMVLSR